MRTNHSLRHTALAFLVLGLVLRGPLFAAERTAQKTTVSSGALIGTISLLLEDQQIVPLDGLFQIDQLEYLGAFRTDSGQYGGDETTYSTNYAVGTLAYNPKNHSLFMVGHAQASRVAEFPIPTPGLQTVVSELPSTGAPLQNFESLFPVENDQGINRITGMHWYKNSLIVNAEKWYDAAGRNTDTTLVVSNADDLGGTVSGFFQMNGATHSAGYMGNIPEVLQACFSNAKYFTGWSSVYSIVSRYSYGPSLWTFDPEDLVASNASSTSEIEATAYLNYPYSSEQRERWDEIDSEAMASPLWNILTDGYFGVFVPGTKTFAVFGQSAGIESGIGYKITQDNGRLCGGYCPQAADDQYNYYWLYNVDDILAADNVSAPIAYDYGKLSLPFDDDGVHGIIGGTFDYQNKTLYLALYGAGQVGQYDRPPLILAYQLSEDE